MADQDSTSQNPPGGGRGRAVEPLPLWLRLFLLVSLAPLIAVLFPTFMLVGLGMLPTLVVYLGDKSRNKSFAMTVALTNLCGVLPSLASLWDRGQSMQAATEIAGDPLMWILPLGAAGVGWLIFMSMPPLIAAYYKTASDARIDNLMLKQRGLVEVWGEEVAERDEEEAAGGEPAAQAEPDSPGPGRSAAD